MSKLKIVTIGGGSSYTPELVEGFILRHSMLPIDELWLVDIDEGRKKLEIVGNLAQRMVEKAGVPMKVFLTTDRRLALKDATFVTTQFRVGLLEARIQDERIPGNYKMFGQETNGAGGLFKALRTAPVILDIISDIQELCPNAFLVNFTNPAGVLTEVVSRYTSFTRFIGVCNVPINQTRHFSKILNVPQEDLIPYFAGLNHYSYVLKLFIKGDPEDKLPIIIDQVKNKQNSMANIDAADWTYEFIHNLGVYPNPYHKYFYLYDTMFASFLKKHAINQTRAELVKKVEDDLFKIYADTSLYVKPKELEKRGGALYSDVACSVIMNIYSDLGELHGVNVANRDCIDGIKPDAGVEVTCKITKDGAIPLKVGKLPIQIEGTILALKAYEELLAEACYERDLDKALLAFQIHPLTHDVNTAAKVFKDLCVAHQKYLTSYKNLAKYLC